uniref:RING-type domain-containing protein n=1 Tax=Strombidinopsis acuminata TaxID=141414 RepID=A0A7S3VV37_9SPIT|mmetsp:Transcript_65229/g.167891  ORF Transcript_65229/g.167891 Transcript_65229/m.167891 type:complete len:282 (-) Transcript_65229:559-1404(-)
MQRCVIVLALAHALLQLPVAASPREDLTKSSSGSSAQVRDMSLMPTARQGAALSRTQDENVAKSLGGMLAATGMVLGVNILLLRAVMSMGGMSLASLMWMVCRIGKAPPRELAKLELVEAIQEQFPVVQISPGELEEGPPTCAVCLDQIGDTEDARTLQCQHHFHAECVMEWWTTERKQPSVDCPLCRRRQRGLTMKLLLFGGREADVVEASIVGESFTQSSTSASTAARTDSILETMRDTASGDSAPGTMDDISSTSEASGMSSATPVHNFPDDASQSIV